MEYGEPQRDISISVDLNCNGMRQTVGRIHLAERDTAGWEVAALLREIADQIESHDPPLSPPTA